VKKKQPTAGAKKAAAGKPGARGAGAKSGKPTARPAAKQSPRGGKTASNRSSAPSRTESATQANNSVRVSRIIDAPAASILRAVTDADRRGWAPVPVARVVSILAPRFVRLALPDGSQVAITITRQGNTRCGVQIEHMGLAANRPIADVKREWMGALAGLAEQLDAEWD
jgi:hypothetical protein